MPNWCEGQLKIRGEYENIKRFLKSELKSYEDISGRKEIPINFTESESYFEARSKVNNNFYLNKSKRGFINSPIGIEIEPKGKEITQVLGTFSCAWNLDYEILTENSKMYGLDFKIYAFESGSEFCRDFEVNKGEVIINEIIEFTDYVWESIDPNIGG